MKDVSYMLTGYEYAQIIERTCEELHRQLGVVPVKGYVYLKDKYGSRWRDVLCHPEDQEKSDAKTFKHPFREI